MQFASLHAERCRNCRDGRDQVGEHPCGRNAAIESRLLLNPVETKVLLAGLWARQQWENHVNQAYRRIECRIFGRHSRFCPNSIEHQHRPA
jgi:predicted anti-sigma-YlaC factor YlaD